ncbi:DUF2798 domain-containing protein [Halomonas saliphila]|uniref:DUF2798 domain-containing protein n=1 Tax=Billgrantia saliphila TaxID=1848458 RepID=UPI000CE41DB0
MSVTPTSPIRFRRLPARFYGFMLSLVLSVLMSGVVSLTVTLRTGGLTSVAISHWPGAWAASWLVAFPALLMVAPLARRLVAMLVRSPT